jgi:hypothetical protein
VPHPSAAKSAWTGGTVKGGACAIAMATRREEAPLPGLPWRATQSEAAEAPLPVQTCPVLGDAAKKLRRPSGSGLAVLDGSCGSGDPKGEVARRAPAGQQGRAGDDAGPRRSAAEPP